MSNFINIPYKLTNNCVTYSQKVSGMWFPDPGQKVVLSEDCARVLRVLDQEIEEDMEIRYTWPKECESMTVTQQALRAWKHWMKYAWWQYGGKLRQRRSNP